MPMNAVSYVKRRQRAWAVARGIPFDGSLLVDHLEHNLFEPLGPQALAEFQAADGHELGGPDHRGHMYSLRSSSAAAVNLFHYWRTLGSLEPICRACKIPLRGASSLHFEARRPIDPLLQGQGAIPPNLDVEIRQDDGGVTAFECKLTEPFGCGHGGLRPRYLRDDLAHVWDGLPNLHALARVVSPKDDRFVHLHAAQLVKHVLGLKAGYGKDSFRLVYLWCDVAGPESVEHAREVEEFARIAAEDGIAFRSLTYQEVILGLAERHRSGNEGYVDYMVGRYL